MIHQNRPERDSSRSHEDDALGGRARLELDRRMSGLTSTDHSGNAVMKRPMRMFTNRPHSNLCLALQVHCPRSRCETSCDWCEKMFLRHSTARQKEETWVDYRARTCKIARKIWTQMGLPFVYEVKIAESMIVCHGMELQRRIQRGN